MKFLKFILWASILGTGIAQADNSAYYFPQSMTCTTSAPPYYNNCNYDTTYLTLADQTISQAGTYTFQYAYTEDTFNLVTLWAIYSDGAGHQVILNNGFNNLVPNTTVSGNQWSSVQGSLLCGSPTLAAKANICPFTHTPFENSTTVPSINNITAYQTNKIIINNSSNYTLVLHVDDYNNSVVHIYQLVPPHSQQAVVADFGNQDPSNFNLMFDIEIIHNGVDSEKRTTMNTAVVTYNIGNGSCLLHADTPRNLYIDGNFYSVMQPYVDTGCSNFSIAKGFSAVDITLNVAPITQ